MKYTEEEMITLWLRIRYNEPLRTDCTVGRTDSADMRSMARRECRRWYYELLSEGDSSMIVPHNLVAEGRIVATGGRNGSVILRLPDECVRPLAVKLTSWDAPAVVVGTDSPLARLQANRFSAGGVTCPVAVHRPDNTLELYSSAHTDSEMPQYLMAACLEYDEDADLPGAWFYEFRPSALATIPEYEV